MGKDTCKKLRQLRIDLKQQYLRDIANLTSFIL